MLDQPCHDLRVRASSLDQAVLETLKAQTEMLLGIDPMSCDLTASTVQQTECEKKMRCLQDEKRRLYEMYADGMLPLDTFQEQKTLVDTELLKTKNVNLSLIEKAKHEQEKMAANAQRQQLIQETHSAEMLTKALVEKTICKVFVFHDQRIEIQYAFQDFIGKAEHQE